MKDRPSEAHIKMMVTAPANAHLEPAKPMRWLQIVQTIRYRLLAEFHFPDSAKSFRDF